MCGGRWNLNRPSNEKTSFCNFTGLACGETCYCASHRTDKQFNIIIKNNSNHQLISLEPPPLLPQDLKQGEVSKIRPGGPKILVDYALETSIFLMEIVFAKCKNAKIFRLRRATNAKTTINMNKRHIYYLNVFFSARHRRKKNGGVLSL